MPEKNPKTILIVGAGITGLAAAYICAKNGYKVRVVEAAKTPGGLLQTFDVNNTPLEYYYHHFFTHDKELRWLLEELGIEDKLKFHKGSMGFYYKGNIYPFSSAIDLLKFRPLNILNKIRFGLTSMYLAKQKNWQNFEHIPALNWFQRFAGKKVTNVIWAPMLKVKFGSYFDQIPIAWMIGRLSQRVRSRSSKGEFLGYIEGSTKILLDTLLRKLTEMGVEIICGEKTVELLYESDLVSGIKVLDKNSAHKMYKGSKILFTIPTNHLATIVEKANPSYAKKLNKIEYFGATCTILQLKKPANNLYWVNVADETLPFGGVIEHTNLVDSKEYKNTHIVYLSKYFNIKDKFWKLTSDEIKQQMLNGFFKMFPEYKKKDVLDVKNFKALTAATYCHTNFSKIVPKYKSPIKNVFVASMAHIYPDERSCNNSIRVAAYACSEMGMDTTFVPKGITLSGRIGLNPKL